MRRGRLLWAAGTALLVLVVLAGGAVFLVDHLRNGQNPPPAAGGPGVVRLTNPDTGRGVPPPEHRVQLSNGRTVLLALTLIDGSGDTATAHLAIVAAPAPTRFVALRRGQATTVPGATIRVLDIYAEPDSSKDAVDVRVTAEG